LNILSYFAEHSSQVVIAGVLMITCWSLVVSKARFLIGQIENEPEKQENDVAILNTKWRTSFANE
jgi:hypothetical protein